jgi:hypothetical protein
LIRYFNARNRKEILEILGLQLSKEPVALRQHFGHTLLLNNFI